MYATNLSGPWLEGVSNGLTNFDATGIAYAQGYWVMSGSYWDSSAYTDYAKVAYITDIIPNSNSTQAWTIQSLMNARYASWDCVTYINGHWLLGGMYRAGSSGNAKYRIAYVKNPPDTWSINEAWTGNPNDTINRIIYADKCWVAVGQGTGYEAVIAYKDSFTLPVISTTNAYNYIKAKEN